MERREGDGPPAEAGGVPVPWPSGQHTPGPGAPPPAPPPWRRFRPRSWKGAIGLGIVAAAVPLFVFVFLDDQARFWVPLAAGFVVLVLLALLRLDRLLNGWTWHVAGVAMLAALVYETSGNPWSWALAVSVGVLLAGLLRLPRVPLVAVGIGLCVLSFVGYQLRANEVREQEAEVAQQAGNEMRQNFGYNRPELVLSKLSEGLVEQDAQAVCNVLDQEAQQQVAQSAGAPDCLAAVTAAAARVPAGSTAPTPDRSPTTSAPAGTIVQVDGCAAVWGRTLPALGRVDVYRTEATQSIWRVASFQSCSPTA